MAAVRDRARLAAVWGRFLGVWLRVASAAWRTALVAMLGAAVGMAALPAAPAGAAPSYRSPGYRGTHRVPNVKPLPPPPPLILGIGDYPRVLVDAAGTGHITWTQGQIAVVPSMVRYCHLPRGQRTCTSQASLVPPEPGGDGFPGNSPLLNGDFSGPFPLAVGNELLLLDHRCCNQVPFPDGTNGSDVNFLYTSEDGGSTFTGPGIVGTQSPGGFSGNTAAVYGGDNPQIGVVSDTQTGGEFFQGSPAGAFTQATANLGDQGPDEGIDGRIAVDGSRPVVAFADLTEHVFVREYSGSGDVNSASNWSVAQVSGEQPRIVGGPLGVFLATRAGLGLPYVVRRIVNGVPVGTPVQVTPTGADVGYPQFTETAGGELIFGWVTRGIDGNVSIRTSTDGLRWSPVQVIAHGTITGNLALGAAADGGGFAVFDEQPAPGQEQGQVAVATFGAVNATGQKGLGNVTGGGLGGLGGDQLGNASCLDVHFGAIDALAEGGCFLRDPRNPTSGAAVTDGEIRLNGLEVIPDAGVRIVINPRLHTIDTTGAVSVDLRAPGIPDITLWHGELHVNLAGGLAGAGQTLFDFNTSQFSAALEGFPINATIDVQIQHDSVVIPISLRLPPYMGGITGQATLLANNSQGLELQSLHIGVDDLTLGALEVKHLHIDYTQQGDVWMGGGTLFIPAGSPYFGLDVQVEFDHGDFTMGSFNLFFPFPGIPIFTDAYLASVGGGFDIHPPKKRFFGTVTAGAIPLDPPNYALTVTGTVSLTFIDNGPVILEVDGSGAVHNFAIATAKLLFQTNGYFEVDGNVDINLDVVELQGGMRAFVDLPGKEFSAEAQMLLSVFGFSTIHADAIISSVGAAACGSFGVYTLGLGYMWGGSLDVIAGIGDSCDLSAYRVAPVSSQAVLADRREHAYAAVSSVPVAAGAPFADIAVTGVGAPPSVLLTSPSGQQITPTSDPNVMSPALALREVKNNTTYIVLAHPAAGNWRVTPAPGSPAITAVQSADGLSKPVITAHVNGGGQARRLTYTTTVRPGLGVTFAEQGNGVFHMLGKAAAARGTIRFAPAAGPAGARTIFAIVSENGIPRQRLAVARYTAPGPARPGRVRGLSVRRRGRTFVVTFRGTRGATLYRLRVDSRDGRHISLVLGRTGHLLRLPVLGYNDRLTVTVTALGFNGAPGPAVRASAR
jgi:hypothetical protein